MLETELTGLYVPSFDDVEMASELMKDFGGSWDSYDTRHRNELLTLILDAAYVDLGARKVA